MPRISGSAACCWVQQAGLRGHFGPSHLSRASAGKKRRIPATRRGCCLRHETAEVQELHNPNPCSRRPSTVSRKQGSGLAAARAVQRASGHRKPSGTWLEQWRICCSETPHRLERRHCPLLGRATGADRPGNMLTLVGGVGGSHGSNENGGPGRCRNAGLGPA